MVVNGDSRGRAGRVDRWRRSYLGSIHSPFFLTRGGMGSIVFKDCSGFTIPSSPHILQQSNALVKHPNRYGLAD
jgi:hypothetical protein